MKVTWEWQQPQDVRTTQGHVLSFGILDDLQFRWGPPQHVQLGRDVSQSSLTKALTGLLEPYRKAAYDEDAVDDEDKHTVTDPSGYFDREFFDDGSYLANIVKSLLEKHMWRYNRYNKYYVIAFAIDYCRFQVYSKDCDKEWICWHDKDTEADACDKDPWNLHGRVAESGYNANPVLQAMAAAHSQWATS